MGDTGTASPTPPFVPDEPIGSISVVSWDASRGVCEVRGAAREMLRYRIDRATWEGRQGECG